MYGFDNIPKDTTAEELEDKIQELFPNNDKLIPYIQKYEFETLLFSEPSYYADYFDNPQATLNIEKIIKNCGGNIEDINNSKKTAPSKRIANFFDKHDETFEKVFHGYSIIEEIGLEKVLEKAPRFRDWVKTIETLTA